MAQANPDGRKKAEAGLAWRKNTDSLNGCTDPACGRGPQPQPQLQMGRHRHEHRPVQPHLPRAVRRQRA